MTSSQTILVTGCSSGLGRQISEVLARHGHTVFATMRDVAGKNAAAATALRQLAATHHWNLQVLELDVTDEAAIARALETAAAATERLDVVVNNAGIMAMGLTEAVSVEQMRQMLEVNVLGAFRVMQAALPYFRRQKAGYAVYISSSSGTVVYPFMGLYGGTKAALSAMAEGWHYELFGLGIDTTIVQAGMYNTALADNVLRAEQAALVAEYGMAGAIAQGFSDNLGASMTLGGDPKDVGELLATLIAKPSGERPLLVPIGPFSEAMGVLNPPRATLQGQALTGLGFGSLLTRASAAA